MITREIKIFLVLLGILTPFSFCEVLIAESDMPDGFFTEFDYIRRKNASVIGVSSKIDAYEKLISKYQPHPCVSLAMFDLGVLYESKWEGQDQNRAIEYYELAAGTADSNTEIWKKANFFLFNRLVHNSFSKAEEVLLHLTNNLHDGDSLFFMQIEDKYVTLYGIQWLLYQKEGDWDKIEEHCGKMLTLYDDPARIPKNKDDKFQIDNLLINASYGMASYIQNSRLSVLEKITRLREMKKKYPLLSMYPHFSRTIESLSNELHQRALSIADNQVLEMKDIIENNLIPEDISGVTDHGISLQESMIDTGVSISNQAKSPTQQYYKRSGKSKKNVRILSCMVIALLIIISSFFIRKKFLK